MTRSKDGRPAKAIRAEGCGPSAGSVVLVIACPSWEMLSEAGSRDIKRESDCESKVGHVLRIQDRSSAMSGCLGTVTGCLF